MEMGLHVLIISMILFFVLFFGIGFLLNMMLRMSWMMAIISPIVFILFIDKVRFIEYFTSPASSFIDLKDRVLSLTLADILILSSGLAGAILVGIVVKLLRKKGYQMF